MGEFLLNPVEKDLMPGKVVEEMFAGEGLLSFEPSVLTGMGFCSSASSVLWKLAASLAFLRRRGLLGGPGLPFPRSLEERTVYPRALA